MVQEYFHKAPFFRIVLPFIAGIAASTLLPQGFLYISLALFVSCMASYLFLLSRPGYVNNLIAGVLVQLALVLAGVSVHQYKNSPVMLTQGDRYLATLLESPVEKARSFRAEARLKFISLGDSIVSANERVIIYFQPGDEVANLRPGDRIVFDSSPQRITNPGNPYEFDYSRFLARKGIFRQVYLPIDRWSPEGKDPMPGTQVMAENLRDRLLLLYMKGGLSGDELAILSALTLGYKKNLDAEVRQTFSASGAMHVLAVSGLHVGIVFLVIRVLLAFLRRSSLGRLAFVVFAVGVLWAYAFVTGFSPSVQRAALMFSILIIGDNLKRPANIYNSLAASAFILLAVNPNLLFEVGFQLSYSAVAGIVYFQPIFSSILNFKNPFFQYAWGLFTVSLAAQLATFPLTCFYFGQFPVYFWISNFIVIPAAFVFIFLAMAILLTSPLAAISALFTQVTAFMVNIVYRALKMIEELPGALVTEINFTVFHLVLVIATLLLLVLFIESRRKPFFFISFLFLSLFFFTGPILKLRQNYHIEAIVYNHSEPLIHLIAGRNNYLIAPAHLFEQQLPEREIRPVIKKHYLFEPVMISFDEDYHDEHVVKSGGYLFFREKAILLPVDGIHSIETVKPDIAFDFPARLSDRAAASATTIIGRKRLNNIEWHDKLFSPSETGAYRVKL